MNNKHDYAQSVTGLVITDRPKRAVQPWYKRQAGVQADAQQERARANRVQSVQAMAGAGRLGADLESPETARLSTSTRRIHLRLEIQSAI